MYVRKREKQIGIQERKERTKTHSQGDEPGVCQLKEQRRRRLEKRTRRSCRLGNVLTRGVLFLDPSAMQVGYRARSTKPRISPKAPSLNVS